MPVTLQQHFSFSKRETLILRGGFGSGNISPNYDNCTVDCSKDMKIPPSEIVSIKEIRTISFEFFQNLDLAETFMMLADAPNLCELQLKSCGIKEVPPEIWALYKLRILKLGNEGYLTNNEFITLPPEFGQLEELQALNLHDNRQFKQFPSEVANLIRLKSINLRGFHSLPENIELIPNLQDIGLVFSHIVPQNIEWLIDRPNGLKSVTVGEDYFNMFNKLTEKYPDFQVSWQQTSMRGNY